MVVPSSPGLIITGPGAETAAAIIITDKCKSVRTGSTVCARLSYLLDDTINCQHNGQSRCVCVFNVSPSWVSNVQAGLERLRTRLRECRRPSPRHSSEPTYWDWQSGLSSRMRAGCRPSRKAVSAQLGAPRQ